MTKRLLALPALLLALAFGCSKGMASSESAAPAPPMEPGAWGGEAEMAEGDWDASGAVARESMPSMADAAPTTTIASPSPSAGQGSPTPEPAVARPDAPDEHGRQIVYTASMQIAVYNVQESMKVVEALPEGLGGWIQTRTEGTVTLKLPAARLRDAMERLAELGNVLARDLHAQDVTDEYVDLETRIRVLRETQTQLIELLKRSKTVEEALNVRRALDDVTMQLEVALGRMRLLQSQIAFSTLTVSLTEQGPFTGLPSSNDPFPWVDSLGVEATEWR